MSVLSCLPERKRRGLSDEGNRVRHADRAGDQRGARRPSPVGRNTGALPDDGRRSCEASRSSPTTYGITAFATTEHHFHTEGGEGNPNPLLMFSHLAGLTKSITFIPLSIVLSAEDPLRVAEDVALFDHLYPGRIGVCFARGYQKRWIQVLSQARGAARLWSERRRPTRADRAIFNDHLAVLLKAWDERRLRLPRRALPGAVSRTTRASPAGRRPTGPAATAPTARSTTRASSARSARCPRCTRAGGPSSSCRSGSRRRRCARGRARHDAHARRGPPREVPGAVRVLPDGDRAPGQAAPARREDRGRARRGARRHHRGGLRRRHPDDGLRVAASTSSLFGGFTEAFRTPADDPDRACHASPTRRRARGG